jgi:hypothetical protein
VAVSCDVAHAFRKPNRGSTRLIAGLGLEGGAQMAETVKHRSQVARDPTQPNLRQAHLIHAKVFDESRLFGETEARRARRSVWIVEESLQQAALLEVAAGLRSPRFDCLRGELLRWHVGDAAHRQPEILFHSAASSFDHMPPGPYFAQRA